MADKLVPTNLYFELDSTDYSSEVEMLRFNPDQAEVPVTNGTSNGAAEFELGLITQEFTVDFVFNADLSTGMHAKLRSVAGTKVNAKLGTVNPATSAAPQASATVLVKPIGLALKVGDAFKVSVTFRITGAVTWVTS